MIKKALPLVLIFTLLTSIVGVATTGQTASAANAADWKSGRIIDDAVFTDPTTMTVAQIQDFLNAKVGTGGYGRAAGQCDTNGQAVSEYGGGTRAQYGATNGNPTPFTCLKDYYEVPKTTPGPGIPASNYGGAAIPPGAKSAAHIIWDAAQAYNISPKTLLVTIQKESAGPLITDDWPFKKQFTYAMGAHCPDGPNGAECDPNYAGFSMQIYDSASLLRYYLDNMQKPWWTYKKPYQVNHVLWNTVYTNCGGGDIYITNKATAALYTYTPYQPNQAALNNLYGTGDGCSAYGNRNFWRMFTDWFGSTQTNTPYAWSVVSQEAFANSARTNSIYASVLGPNQTVYLRLKARNIGYETWTNTGANAVKIGTNNPRERNSSMCLPSWLGCNRPVALKEATVAPGDIGTFEFAVKVPSNHGVYKEHFNLLAEGKSWMNDTGMYWQLEVKPPTFIWQYGGQNTYADAAKTKPINSKLLAPNTNYYLVLKARNLGNADWKNSGSHPVNLGTNKPTDRLSSFCNGTWINCTRPTSANEASVAPGETATFEFQITTPGQIKDYNEYFRPVVEGVGWMNDQGVYWPIGVKPPTYAWQYQSQTLYSDSSRTTKIDGKNIANNSTFYARLKARNTGNVIWSNIGPNPVRLGTSSPNDHSSSFCDTSWDVCNRAATLQESSVAPGEIGTFDFTFKAPYSTNNFTAIERFNLLSEGKMWMNDLGLYFPLTFSSPLDTWQYISQGVYSDSARTVAANSSSLSRNTTYYVRLKAKNISGQIWQKGKVNLGTSNPQDRVSSFCVSSWITCNRATSIKETAVNPGQTGTFDFAIKTPSSSGTYNEYFRPLVEGKYWMTDVGLYWGFGVN